MDTLWISVCAFLVLGALGVFIEHLRVNKWIKNSLMWVIGGLMLVSMVIGLIAVFFS
ncbi:MAG TPA: hypothetical protein VN616_18010 [Puia sp.]|nr:hypothetical protein [Puia sp.]